MAHLSSSLFLGRLIGFSWSSLRTGWRQASNKRSEVIVSLRHVSFVWTLRNVYIFLLFQDAKLMFFTSIMTIEEVVLNALHIRPLITRFCVSMYYLNMYMYYIFRIFVLPNPLMSGSNFTKNLIHEICSALFCLQSLESTRRMLALCEEVSSYRP